MLLNRIPGRARPSMSPLEGESQFPIVLRIPHPSWFSNPSIFEELICLVQIPRAGVPDVRHQPLTLPEEAPDWQRAYCVLGLWGLSFLWRPHLCLSHLSLWGSFILWLSSRFRIFFTGKWSTRSCKFGVSMGEDAFRIFLRRHLASLSRIHF